MKLIALLSLLLFVPSWATAQESSGEIELLQELIEKEMVLTSWIGERLREVTDARSEVSSGCRGLRLDGSKSPQHTSLVLATYADLTRQWVDLSLMEALSQDKILRLQLRIRKLSGEDVSHLWNATVNVSHLRGSNVHHLGEAIRLLERPPVDATEEILLDYCAAENWVTPDPSRLADLDLPLPHVKVYMCIPNRIFPFSRDPFVFYYVEGRAVRAENSWDRRLVTVDKEGLVSVENWPGLTGRLIISGARGYVDWGSGEVQETASNCGNFYSLGGVPPAR